MRLYSGLWGAFRHVPQIDETMHPCITDSRDNKYGATFDGVAHHEPSLTRDYNEENGVWMPLKSCLFYIFIYFAISVIAYSYVFEHWSVIDSIYFAVATFTTVGYGDMEPTTQGGQIFTIFFAIYGVIILGVFIGIFGHSVSQAQARTIRKIKQKKQSKLLKLLFADYDSERKQEADREAIQESIITDHQDLLDDIKRVCWQEFPQILFVMILAYILGLREGWTFTSTVYFCFMSASTTGFGDYTPTTTADKIYCIFFFPISVAVFGEVLGKIAGIYIQNKFRKAERNFLKRSITMCDLNRMDADDDGEVDFGEFLSFMLVALQKVDKESIDELKRLFDSLDKDGNGVLDKEDLVEYTEDSPLYDIQEAILEEEGELRSRLSSACSEML